MSRYTPVSADAPPSYPPRPAAQRSGTTPSAHISRNPDRELEAAFDDSDDDDDDENLPLSQTRGGRDLVWDAGEDAGLPDEDRAVSAPAPAPAPADGIVDPLRSAAAVAPAVTPASLLPTDAEPTYDFDRDYFLPPPGSPPPGAYPENYAPTGPTPLTTTPAYPSAPSAPSRFIRSLLPTHFTRSGGPAPRGSDGVFANLAAKPELELPAGTEGSDGDNTSMMAEFASKDAPPAYNVAARDAVPPYWEHNVVAPSFGPLGSITGSGDDLLIDGLPVGNFFGFAWNLLVSMSFQFVGFLLTYVLHTTHSSKYGSRAGLGVTLIQYGFYLRSRAQEIRDTGDIDPDGTDGTGFVDGWSALFGSGDGAGGGMYEASSTIVSSAVATATATASAVAESAAAAIPTFGSWAEALQWKHDHPDRVMPSFDAELPSAEEVSEANEWLSFVLMCIGWFILITSLGGYWRVKRYERSLLAAQESEDDASSVPAPGIGLGAIRDWYRSRSSATPASGSSAAADNTSYPGADLGLHEEEPAPAPPREGGRGDNAFRAVGRTVRDWRAQFLARANAIREFRDRQRERERREEEGEFML